MTITTKASRKIEMPAGFEPHRAKIKLLMKLQSCTKMLPKMDIAMSSFKIALEITNSSPSPPPKKKNLDEVRLDHFSPPTEQNWPGWGGWRGHCVTKSAALGPMVRNVQYSWHLLPKIVVLYLSSLSGLSIFSRLLSNRLPWEIFCS